MNMPARINAIVLGAAMAVSAAIVLYAARTSGGDGPPSWLSIALSLVFLAWVSAPFALGIRLFRTATLSIVPSVIVLIGHLVLACGAAAIYIYTFVLDPHPDPQAGLVFLFAPLYQAALGAVLWGIARGVQRVLAMRV